MDAQTVRTALGTLQTNPLSESTWESLAEAIRAPGGDLGPADAREILDAARARHGDRGESAAALRLLVLVEELVDRDEEKLAYRLERAHLLVEQRFEGAPARELLRQTLEESPDAPALRAYLDELDGRAERWPEQAATYLGEAESATDDAYQSAMLMRAAEAELCFAKEPKQSAIIDNLERAVRLDSSNVLAARMLEVLYQKKERFEDEARVLERLLERGPDAETRASAGVRRARVLLYRLGDEARAAASYDRVLETVPSHPDALEFVTDYYSKNERWDELVRVFERPLRTPGPDEERLGELFQVAMLHYKKRGQLADAEPWFARIRKIDPAHEGVLSFYRDYKTQLGDDAGLVQVLQEAQRALPQGDPRAHDLSNELLKFAESQANAHRAIEQYKAVLRGDPDSLEARAHLKTLYKQTQGHNALVELLRQELDRTKEDDIEGRLAILREIASIYREYMKSETALVGVLNQIVQLDGKLDANDVGEVRELVFLYERLGRHRDLLAAKKLLAEIVPDVEEKKALYRQSGRLWLDQFSNVQQAMEAYAALHAIDKSDAEAIERLDELYRKRRAWKELHALYEEQLLRKEGADRVPVLRELALLLAERLNRGDEALALYREIANLDPTRTDALDRMEKLAERAKNWEALAESLERRLSTLPEDETRLPVLTKLGSVYAEHLEDAEKSIHTFRRVVEIQPGNARAMRVLRDAYLKGARYDELEELYASQNDIEGLAEVLSTAADRASETDAKLELSYRAARVYEERLGAAPRAIRSYERILGLEPKDRRAIERLLPLYEADEKWARVPGLLETLVELTDDPSEKVSLLGRLGEVSGTRLGDRRAAVAHARRAFEIAPTDVRSLGYLDAACRSAGSWEEMLAALEARLAEISVPPPEPAPKEAPKGKGKRGKGKKPAAPEVPVEAASARPLPTEEERELGLRVARVLGEELGRVADAMERLRALGESFPNDPEILRTFESMLGRQQRPEDVRWLFEHRAAHVSDSEERARILCEYGGFEEQLSHGERDVIVERALPLYERAWEEKEDYVPALEALARVALLGGQDELAAKAIEAHRDLLHGVERGEKEVLLASLYAERIGRPRDALASAERALAEKVEPGLIIPVLQKLVEVQEVRADAARLLSEQYEAGGNARQEADAVRALLSETKGESERIALYERLASIFEEKLGELGSALGVLLEALRLHPDQLVVWDRAETLARASGRAMELADTYREVMRGELTDEVAIELCRRAALLAEGTLGDSSAAVPYFERILAITPDDEEAFSRLKEILTSGERWSELEELYDREIARLDDEGRRVEMLAEVALLTEDIMGDAERAATYHRRILEIDPVSSVSLESLDRLLARLGKNEELIDLLDKRIELATSDAKVALLVRSAQLALALLQPERSVQAVEQILVESKANYEARDVAEELLKVGSVRIRAARALESVYETRDEIRDLVRVLGVRVEGLRPAPGESLSKEDAREREDERRDLLRRIATLRDDRLHDDEGSFDVFAELSPLDPLDSDLRERLVDAGRRLGRNVKVVEVLRAAAAAADVSGVQAEILMQAARVQSDVLEDVRGAEDSLRAVVELRESEPEFALEALRQLEQIVVLEKRHEDLARVYDLQVELETDFDRKRKLLGVLANHASEVLGDPARAIAAWEARLEESTEDPEALLALTELYEKASRPSDLARVLASRRDLATSDKERIALMRRLARVEEESLADFEKAIESYQALEAELPADAEVLEALARLYGKLARHQDLADIHQKQADTLEDESARLVAWVALGRVLAEKLDDVPGALEAYRRALSIDMKEPAARSALRALLAHSEASVRLDAAGILIPVYESEGDFEGQASILEVEINSTDDPDQKRDKLERLVELSEGPLSDPSRAMGYALRGAKLAAEGGDLGAWFDILERLGERSSSRKAQAELLESVAKDLFDPAAQARALGRAAELMETSLGDARKATELYERALDVSGEDQLVLLALENLYRKAGESEKLLAIYARREELAESDDHKKALSFARAALLEGPLGRKGDAIGVLESIVDLDFDGQAIAALERLYESEKRFDDLATLLQRRIDDGRDDPISLRIRLASVLEGSLGDFERAIDEAETALEADTQNAATIRYLESLLDRLDAPETKARVAGLLEPVYMVRADYDRVLSTLRTKLDGSSDPGERRELFTRMASIHEEQREDYRAALEVTAKLLEDDPADAFTISEMERLAKVASAEERLAELFAAQLAKLDTDDDSSAGMARRAGEIFLGKGRPKEALPLLERAMAFAPEEVSVFEMVDAALRQVGTAEDRVALYRGALDHRYDPSERSKMFHTIAELSEKSLGNLSEAIDAYQEALTIDEGDLAAAEALTRLYRAEKRFEELAELFSRRADAVGPTEAAPFRLALAQVYESELSRPEAALDQLEEIVAASPSHKEAIARIESFRAREELRERAIAILRPLYEGVDDWNRIIRLNEDRLALATDPHERVEILRETADLWERRGNDHLRASGVLRAAFRLTPEEEDLRFEVERLTMITEEWGALVELYAEVLTEHPDLGNRLDLIRRLAEVADERLDDPRAALSRYEELFAADPSDGDVVFAMHRLALLLAEWPALERALEAKVDIVYDDEERLGSLVRLGDLRWHTLDKREEAATAFERAFELDPANAGVVDRVIEASKELRNYPRLVEAYQARVDIPGASDDEKYSLFFEQAGVFEKQLEDKSRAVEALQSALLSRPGDPAVVGELNRLYRELEMWPDLLDNLRLDASTAETLEKRLAIRHEIATILEEKLSSYDEALETYGTILEEKPDDAKAADLALALAEREEHLRREAADILVPALRQTTLFEHLIRALELRLGAETEPTAKADILGQIVAICEDSLVSPARAFEASVRAMHEDPADERRLNETERLAAAAGATKSFADELQKRAEETFEPELARDLWVRLARLVETKLGDVKRSVVAYEKACEQLGDQLSLLEELDRLQSGLGDKTAVIALIERRMALADSDEAQSRLLARQAELTEEAGDSAEAVSLLRQALERDVRNEGASGLLEKLLEKPSLFDEVFDALDGVYRDRPDGTRLADLHRRRVARAKTADERLTMRRSLAQVLEEDCREPLAAQRVLAEGLVDDVNDDGLVDEIERLVSITGEVKEAADALLAATRTAKGASNARLAELCVRAAHWLRDKAADASLGLSALERAHDLAPESEEILEELEGLYGAPGAEPKLLGVLEKRALLAPESDRIDLLRRAVKLAQGLEQWAVAEKHLRSILEIDEQDLESLELLTYLRKAANDGAETFELLVRRADLEADFDKIRVLKLEAAELARGELARVDASIEILESLLESEPDDAEVARGLRGAYEQAGRYADLGRLIERQMDGAEGTLLLELKTGLAKLTLERLGDSGRATELLEEVFAADPTLVDASEKLADLYRTDKSWERLVDLHEKLASVALDGGDTTAHLRELRAVATLLEVERKLPLDAASVWLRIVEHEDTNEAQEKLLALYLGAGEKQRAADVVSTLAERASGGERARRYLELAELRSELGDDEGVLLATEAAFEAEASRPNRERLRKLYEGAELHEKLAALVASAADTVSEKEGKIDLLREAAHIHIQKRGDHGSAAELLRRASELAPEDRPLLLELCDAYSHSGRGADAASVLERIVESYGGKRAKELGEIHRRLATAYLSLGESAKALEELDRAFRIEPGNISVLKQLGEVSMAAGDHKKAMQMYRALLLQKLGDQSPITKAEVFLRLGEVHRALGEVPQARQMFERATKEDPSLIAAKDALSSL